jgi:hypothetical protein
MRITIDDTGQTVTLNPTNTQRPDDGLQRITEVYFAKKVVNDMGRNVSFVKIDSLHAQQDATGQAIAYDTILGKAVYLIVVTNNMATLSVDVVLRPSNSTMTGNTETLRIMKYNGTSRTYEATNLLTAQVGNFDALNPRTGAHAYTNTNNFSNTAIFKLQIRPDTQALFNAWARNIGNATVNIEAVVERTDNQPCAYGPTSTTEVEGAEVFLNTDAVGRFRLVNRNFFTVYHGNNDYNIYALNGANRRRIGKVQNESSTDVCYIYYDRYDNEMLVTTCAKTSVVGRGNGRTETVVPPGYIRRAAAPAGGDAQMNYYYADNSIVTSGTHATNRILRYNALANNVDLVRMPNGLAINNVNNTTISFIFSGTQRRFCNPQCFAAFVGALAQFGQQMRSTGMCFGDATSYPSKSHPNGDSVDTSYKTTLAEEQRKVTAFHEYGFTQILRGRGSFYASLVNSTYMAFHEDHLHAGDFSDNFVQPLY